MRAETAATILEYLPGCKWASPDSAKHQQAAEVLDAFTHEDIVQACKTLRATLSRTHATAEEIAGEVKRNQRKAVIAAKAMQDGIDPYEVEQERKAMRSAILLAPADLLRRAVALCRKTGVLGAEPLSANREEWSAYAVGMVYVTLERMERDGTTVRSEP